MINVKIWDSTEIDQTFSRLLKSSFNENNLVELNLVHNKTFVVTIYSKKQLVGTISLISNNSLMSYLKSNKKNFESILNLYSFKAEKGAYIYNLAVNNKYRNKGVGNKLIRIALHIAKLKKYSYVQTHCDNEISAHLFKKNKFSIENVFQNDKRIAIKLMTSWL